MQLAFEQTRESGPVMVLLHGMFGNGRNWGRVVRELPERSILTPDLRAHGRSEAQPPLDLATMAGDVLDLIADHADGPVDLVGHSLGGKVAMHAALARPEAVRNLVIADIAPRAYGAVNAGLLEAMLALDGDDLDDRGTADRALAAAGVDDDRVRAFLLTNLRNRSDGGVAWQPGIALIDRWRDALDAGLDDDPRTFTGPTLLIRGTASTYVDPEDLALLRRWFPQAQERAFEGAGHWLHAERPRAFAAAIAEFCDA